VLLTPAKKQRLGKFSSSKKQKEALSPLSELDLRVERKNKPIREAKPSEAQPQESSTDKSLGNIEAYLKNANRGPIERIQSDLSKLFASSNFQSDLQKLSIESLDEEVFMEITDFFVQSEPSYARALIFVNVWYLDYRLIHQVLFTRLKSVQQKASRSLLRAVTLLATSQSKALTNALCVPLFNLATLNAGSSLSNAPHAYIRTAQAEILCRVTKDSLSSSLACSLLRNRLE
jgi:hypothetical protein